eukprot:COSAG01_NODE_544_length_15682_cov_107.959379_8_plen_392_part_00
MEPESEPEDEEQAAAAAAAAGPSSGSSTDLLVEAAPAEAPATSADDDGRPDVAGQAPAAAEGGEGAQDAVKEGVPPQGAGADAGSPLLATVIVEGHECGGYNGVYRRVGEHAGQPRFERTGADGKSFHMYCHAGHGAWFLRSTFAPDEDARKSWVGAPSGRLPTGRATWLHGKSSQATDGWQDRPLMLTACATEMEAEQHEARLRAEAKAAREAAAAAARAQAAGLAALRVQGHQTASLNGVSLNGVYRAAAAHEGWLHYESVAGMHLYYHPQHQQWRLSTEFAPAGTACLSWVSAPEGPVPMGQRTWQCLRHGQWVGREVTLTAYATEAEAEQHEARLRAEAEAAREAASPSSSRSQRRCWCAGAPARRRRRVARPPSALDSHFHSTSFF